MGSYDPQVQWFTVASMRFEVQLTDGSSELVDSVDGYAPEGALTTFFSVEMGRAIRLDPWSVRHLSIRTDRISRIALIALPCEVEYHIPTIALVAG